MKENEDRAAYKIGYWSGMTAGIGISVAAAILIVAWAIFLFRASHSG